MAHGQSVEVTDTAVLLEIAHANRVAAIGRNLDTEKGMVAFRQVAGDTLALWVVKLQHRIQARSQPAGRDQENHLLTGACLKAEVIIVSRRRNDSVDCSGKAHLLGL